MPVVKKEHAKWGEGPQRTPVTPQGCSQQWGRPPTLRGCPPGLEEPAEKSKRLPAPTNHTGVSLLNLLLFNLLIQAK